MPPTIIRFLDNDDQPGAVSFFLARPNVAPNFRELAADPSQPPYTDLHAQNLPAGAVTAVGQALYQALLKNDAVKAHFNNIFADTANEPPRPIGMQVDSQKADSLPWETLYRPGDEFLALDRRWPVVRMLDPSDDKLRQDYQYAPPLRIAAVLSAWGSVPGRQIGAADEWRSIEKGIAGASAHGVEVLILVGESSLKEEIDRAHRPNVRAALIANQSQLSQELKNFHPHILHFFCHGHSGEKSYLQIATTYNRDMDEDGSIFLLPKDLRQDIDSEESVWLVVLNCCDSANSIRSGDMRNLAASLVKAGFPAVIGMREPVDSNYARLLTEEFYTAVIPRLDLLPEGPVSFFEWAELLVGGRKRLRDDCAPKPTGPNSAANAKHWAIPALYMRTLAFRMRKLPPKPRELSDPERAVILSKVEGLREQRASAMQMNLPPEMKRQMLAAFDHQIGSEEARLL